MPITATRTTTLRPGDGDQDNDGFVDFGDVLRHTLVLNNTGTQADGVVVNDPLNGSTLTGTVNVSPLAFDDTYTAIGNTLLEVGNATAQTGPQSSVAGSVLANDVEFGGDTFGISAFDATSANGGTVSMVTVGADAGSFTYISAAGFTGTDTFTYTIRDDGLDGIAGNADDLTSVGTVTITITDQVWYVDSTAGPGGDGTSGNPFQTLTAAGAASGANDYVYVEGAASGSIALAAGEQLIGTGVNLVVGGFTLATAGSNSSVNLAGAGFTVTLGTGNTIAGVDVLNTNGGALTGAGFGTLTVNDVALDSSGQALSLTNGAFAGAGFNSTDSDGGTNNVSLSNVTGNVNLGGGALSGATGVGVSINGGGGGVDFNGTLTHTGNARAIDVQNKTGGSVDFDGAVTSNGQSDGVLLNSNSGATINFDGGLTIDTSASVVTAFSATGGGTVTVTGANNTINSGSGTAVTVTNTTIGANDITFQSINQNGGTNSVVLNNTGSAGGFHLTGTGLVDGSAGTIQNVTTRAFSLTNTADVVINNVNLTNANTANGSSLDLDVSNSNAAIYMSSVTGASVNNVNINGTADSGVVGINVSNFVMDNSTITLAGNGAHESGIEFSNLSGTSSISNTEISFSETNGIDIVNTDVSLNLTLNNVTLRDSQTVSSGGAENANGEGGFQFRSFSNAAGAPTTNIDIVDSDFLRLRTQGIQIVGEDDSVVSVDIVNNVIDALAGVGAPTATHIGTGIDINGNDTADVFFNVIGNTIQSRNGAVVNVTSFLDSDVMGRVNNNALTANGIGDGIRFVAQETSGMIVEARNNTVTLNAGHTGSFAMTNQARFQSARLDVTLDGNNINSASNIQIADIDILAGSSAAGETNQVWANIINNTTNNLATRSVRFRESDLDGGSSPQIFLQGFVEAGSADQDGEATWNANGNTPMGGDEVAISSTGSGTPTDMQAGTVLTPTNPTPLMVLPTPIVPTPGAVAPDSDLDGGPAPTGPIVVDDGVLSQAELDLIVDAAIDRWAAAGASEAQLAAMRATTISVQNLAGLNVGLSAPGQITIDDNAAGYSWFIDATPGDDSEFTGSGTLLNAAANTVAGQRVDLLTTVMHELGHQIGLGDTYAGGELSEVMFGLIAIGQRRLPGADDAAEGTGAPASSGALALAPVNIGTIPAGKSVTLMWDSIVDAWGAGFVPTYTNASTISGSSPATSNTETLSASSPLALDSLTLGGTVWNDDGAGGGGRNNGARDGTEAGVDGVSVTLFIDNGTVAGTWDASDTLVVGSTQVTAGGGTYSFTGLAPGDYIVRVDLANFTGGALNLLQASSGTTPEPIDPDNNVANDDNGARASGDAAYSGAITLAYNTEPTADGTGQFDINTTLGFGFLAPHVEPTLTATGSNPTFTEGGAAADLFSGVSASTIELGQSFTSLTLTVSNVTDGASEVLTFDGSDVALTNGNAVTTATNGLNVTVTLAAGLATVTFTGATLTQAALQTLVDGLAYRNTSDNPTDADRVVTLTQLVDSGLNTAPDDNTAALSIASTVDIAPVDDAAVAQDDAVSTAENVVGTGSVFANNGSGADSDVDGPALTVAAVNGAGGNVGNQFTLPSGALLTVNADGSYSYDPNGQFNYLVSSATAALTGAVNTSATDTFTYALTGGNTATVTVMITGADGAGGQLWGDGGNNAISDLTGLNYFDMSQGGDDTVDALAGSDIIYYGTAFTAADQNDGGPEGRDVVVLQGNYTLTLGALSLVNVEYLSLQSGSVTKFGQDGTNSYDYNITTVDANALPSPPAQKLVINGQSLQAGEDLTFDGSAESDGGAYLVYAGFGTDTLTGGNGADVFHFEGARFGLGDTVDGGAGMDALVLSMGTGINHIEFGETQLTSIESISVNNRFASDPLATPSYELVLRNGNVTSGGMLIVNGSSLTVPQTIDVDGSLVAGGTLRLYGGAGDDTLIGGALGDLIYAAGGSDQSTGGLGSDTFQYRNVADSLSGAEDTILDFEVGIDQLDLSFIDAQTGGVNNAFSFIGASAFGGNAGELRAELIGGVWNVEGDVNGDGAGDFLILVTATTADPITAADFIL